jgi:hypothetical protein
MPGARRPSNFPWSSRRATEANFFGLLERLARDPADPALEARESWLARLRSSALSIFDERVPSEGLEYRDWVRLVRTREKLGWTLNGPKIRGRLGLPATPGRSGTK